MRVRIAVMILSGLAILPGIAQESVYGPSAPAGAGFVRVIHGAGGTGPVSLEIGEASFGPVRAGEGTPYRPVSQGLYVVALADTETEVFPRAGIYQTVAITDDGVKVISDTVHEDPARAQLVLYNLTGRAAAKLVVEPSGEPVLEAVPAGGAESRAVNAVTVALAVTAGEGERTGPVRVELRRGGSYGFLAYEVEGRIEATVVEATVEVDG